MPDSVLSLLSSANNLVQAARLEFTAGNSQADTQVPLGDLTKVPLETLLQSVLGEHTWGGTGVGGNDTQVELRGGPGDHIPIPEDWVLTGPYIAGNNYGGPGTADVYSMDFINNIVDLQIEGAGDAMNELMETLQYHLNGDDPTIDARAIVDQMAELRCVDPDEMWAMYEKTMEIFNANVRNYDEIDEDDWPNYLGSNHSLQFGMVVGDSIGLDAVFGALLHPTGGIAGPFNQGVLMEGEAVGYHSIFHDAGGFMINQLGIGPGWYYVENIVGADDYFEPFQANAGDGAVDGQLSGVTFFTDLLNSGGNTVSNGIRVIGDGVEALFGIGGDLLEDWGNEFDDRGFIWGDAIDGITGITGTLLTEVGQITDEWLEFNANLLDGNLLGAAGDAFQLSWEVLNGVFNTRISVITETASFLIGAGEDIVDGIIDVGGGIISGLGSFLGGIF